MSDLIKLEPKPLREVWDGIKPCLEEMKRDWPELGTWRVEDVYAAVLNEEAIIYTTEDGFAICTRETDEFSLRSDLCIWIAYAYEPSRGGILEKYLMSFIAAAKSLGYSGVTTKSNHPAVAKMAGLEAVYTHYRVEVDGEET